jgi:hypothetical protein
MIEITPKDRDILRRLAAEQAEIAQLPIQREKAELWRRLNDLDSVRPMVWITEIPWHEMNVNDELTLQTSSAWTQAIEVELRRRLYQWRHMPADMVMDDYIACPWVMHSTGVGISEDVDIRVTDQNSEIYSRRFHRQIQKLGDIDKIRMPIVTCDHIATQEHYEMMADLFADILPVYRLGHRGKWFAPWDELIRWYGVENAMTDLIDQPELVHAAMDRLVTAKLHELQQWIDMGLLSRNDNNVRVGSGGYGYTSSLPGDGMEPHRLQPMNMWGCATAQIFSDVSEAMHLEFALRHELRWLQKWGVNYYGCCEPLERKMGILRTIPRLRKISISPRANIDRAVSEIGTDYVISRKPNPAFLAWESWQPQAAQDDLLQYMHKAAGCHSEIILKDISTVRYEPRRLWEWSAMAMRLAEKISWY